MLDANHQEGEKRNWRESFAALNLAILLIHAAKSLLHRAGYHSLCYQVEACEGMLVHSLHLLLTGLIMILPQNDSLTIILIRFSSRRHIFIVTAIFIGAF